MLVNFVVNHISGLHFSIEPYTQCQSFARSCLPSLDRVRSSHRMLGNDSPTTTGMVGICLQQNTDIFMCAAAGPLSQSLAVPRATTADCRQCASVFGGWPGSRTTRPSAVSDPLDDRAADGAARADAALHSGEQVRTAHLY